MPRRGLIVGLLALASGIVMIGGVILLIAATGADRPEVDTAIAFTFPEHAGQPPGHPMRGPGWVVIDRLTAHAVMIVEVETDRLHESLLIAAELVAPVKDRYSETLVYFFRPGQSGGVPVKRVQWTPKGGYVETLYERTDP